MQKLGNSSLNRHGGKMHAVTRLMHLLWLVNMALLPVLAVLFAVLQAGPARASETISIDQVQSGSLLLERKGEAGTYVEAPRLASDVNLAIAGPTARARLTQVFENPSDQHVEAIYVFPLPADSAVYDLKLVIGDRVIVADIKEKQAARAAYEQAKSDGKKAALIEQQRPNIFTNAVANIGPHEKVVVQIEYQQAVQLADGRFSLRTPLVVAPRYNPAAPIVEQADLRSGWGTGKSQARTDKDNQPVDTPLAHPASGRINPVTISVNLKAGFPLAEVKSLYHAIDIEEVGDSQRLISLKGEVAADRDFVLEWAPPASNSPNVGLFHEQVGKDDYLLAFVTPPAGEVPATLTQDREIIFVIDNSGSMGGTSMHQAKASLDYALSRLAPGDRFNVIRFDDTMTKFFDDAVMANQVNVEAARRYVGDLEASGGTEMLAPLNAALDDSHISAGLRQIVFLTDGEISNEQQMLDTIAARRDRSRIFMVGIGSAPNTFLMSRAAELGRGSFTHIGAVGEVDSQMRALFDRLENPAVTNLRVDLTDRNASLTPSILPDVYRGEPLVIAARIGNTAGNMTITGMIGNQPWTMTLPLADAAPAEGISKIWARRKIDDAEVDRTLGRISQEAADARILPLALEHHLVTRLTSLVAIDKTPSRPANLPLTRADIPLQLPAGWDFDSLFGTSAARDVTDHAKVDSATRGPAVALASAETSLPLPQTATPAMLQLLQGLALIIIAFILFQFTRRQEKVQ